MVRDVAGLRLNEPRLEPYEVCAEVAADRTAPVGYARVAAVTIKPEHVSEVIDGWPGDVARYRSEGGFRGALFCCDRASGVARSISFWASRADVESNESSGTFQSTVAPYAHMMAAGPEKSYWDARILVER